MSEKLPISALLFEDTGEVKCGNCGKTLLICIRKRPKSSKIKDKIIKKCNRCKIINEFEL